MASVLNIQKLANDVNLWLESELQLGMGLASADLQFLRIRKCKILICYFSIVRDGRVQLD